MDYFKKVAQAIIRVVPVPLAGGGPVTQTLQIDEFLENISSNHDVIIRRIGVKGEKPSFVNEQITGKFLGNDRYINIGENINNIYENCYEQIKYEISDLVQNGIKHILVVFCGYTSYGLFGLKKVLKEINLDRIDKITANAIIQDSSFPDTDKLSYEIDSNEIPTTRFFGPAYESDDFLKIIFVLNAAVDFDISLSKRLPKNCYPIISTFPFTKRYIQEWSNFKNIDEITIRNKLSGIIDGWEKIKTNDWIVSLLSSDIWSTSAIGKWMTKKQYETVSDGTINIVNALIYLALKNKIRIILPIVKTGADFIQNQNLDNVFLISQIDKVEYGVILIPYEVLTQDSFIFLILSSNVIINRAVQANSFAETILAYKPQIVYTIPADGYMEAELMALNINNGKLNYNSENLILSNEIENLIKSSEYRKSNIEYFQNIFNTMYANPNINFGELLIKFSGLKKA